MSDNKFVKLVSPKGIAVYPRLEVPDVKYNPDGVYGVKLKVTEKQLDALLVDLKPFEEQAKDMHSKLPPAARKKAKYNGCGFSEEYADDGSHTGFYLFKFSMKAKGVYKKGPKTGKEWVKAPIIVDSAGQRMTTAVGGGSEIKVNFTPSPYCNAAVGSGVSLKLNGVKVIKLVPKNTGELDYGDDDDEEDEGFVSNTSQDDDGDY